VLPFAEALGVPRGHVLRQVAPDPIEGAADSRRANRWEHEEYDGQGKLVAVYESWPRANGRLAFVKYSAQGWLLRVYDGVEVNSPARQSKTVRAA
jgi:hypothetical protein